MNIVVVVPMDCSDKLFNEFTMYLPSNEADIDFQYQDNDEDNSTMIMFQYHSLSEIRAIAEKCFGKANVWEVKVK